MPGHPPDGGRPPVFHGNYTRPPRAMRFARPTFLTWTVVAPAHAGHIELDCYKRQELAAGTEDLPHFAQKGSSRELARDPISFPGSAWERPAARLRLANRDAREENGPGCRRARRSLATVGSQAEPGTQGFPHYFSSAVSFRTRILRTAPVVLQV